MKRRLEFKKVGNHWYACVEHDEPYEVQLSLKVERCLTKLDWMDVGKVTIELEELNTVIEGKNIIRFSEEDVLRYLTTRDCFDMKFGIDEHEFEISSDLYFLLEKLYHFNFHSTFHRINFVW